MVAHPEVELSALDAARVTLARAREYALGLQHADGWWQGELETNVTMDAEDLLLRQFLGVRDDAATAAAARWIRSQQREDGTWANFYGGPADLSTTVEAYVALRLAGDEPDAPHMEQACGWILSQGGVEATRVFTRLWLALSGRWSWDDLPVIPPELIYLPAWFPLNIYDWGCWARQTIVALAVVQSFRPSRPLSFTIDELKTGATPSRPAADPWAKVFSALDKALRLYRPVKSVRRAALRRCAEWIIARQERDGCRGGIQPPGASGPGLRCAECDPGRVDGRGPADRRRHRAGPAHLRQRLRGPVLPRRELARHHFDRDARRLPHRRPGPPDPASSEGRGRERGIGGLPRSLTLTDADARPAGADRCPPRRQRTEPAHMRSPAACIHPRGNRK